MVSQSVGFDSGKLVKGRKRHFLVDTLGLLWILITGFCRLYVLRLILKALFCCQSVGLLSVVLVGLIGVVH